MRELHEITGSNKYLFPNQRDHQRPATDFGILAAAKRMRYKGKMTGHGFRSLAMGVIKEKLGYRHEVVGRQLSHASGDLFGEAYDRSRFFDERKKNDAGICRLAVFPRNQIVVGCMFHRR